jgi:hypothetical protein
VRGPGVRRCGAGDGVVAFALGTQTVLDDLVETPGFGLVALDGVGDFLGRVAVEMVCLTLGKGLERRQGEGEFGR